VQDGEQVYEFRSEEALRAMTVGELTAYLQEAGFELISAYPSCDLSLKDERCSDRMILLGHRPAGTE
jgi:hypothetical protein